jgi:hypothetical protein
MDLLDIFDMSKKFERVLVPGSQTQGHVKTCDEQLFYDPFDIKKPSRGLDYARQYQIQEENEMAQVSIM